MIDWKPQLDNLTFRLQIFVLTLISTDRQTDRQIILETEILPRPTHAFHWRLMKRRSRTWSGLSLSHLANAKCVRGIDGGTWTMGLTETLPVTGPSACGVKSSGRYVRLLACWPSRFPSLWLSPISTISTIGRPTKRRCSRRTSITWPVVPISQER